MASVLDQDWTDPDVYAQTTTSALDSLKTIAGQVGGFAGVVSAPAGAAPTIQGQPFVAGPVAEGSPDQGVPFYRRWASELGAPVWAVVTGGVALVTFTAYALWRVFRR